jgi:hypothetical protein
VYTFTHLKQFNFMATKKDAILAYCMKTKEKNVPLENPIIFRRKRSRGEGFSYQAQGTYKGNKCCAMMGGEKALAAIESGVATKDAASWKESGK